MLRTWLRMSATVRGWKRWPRLMPCRSVPQGPVVLRLRKVRRRHLPLLHAPACLSPLFSLDLAPFPTIFCTLSFLDHGQIQHGAPIHMQQRKNEKHDWEKQELCTLLVPVTQTEARLSPRHRSAGSCR